MVYIWSFERVIEGEFDGPQVFEEFMEHHLKLQDGNIHMREELYFESHLSSQTDWLSEIVNVTLPMNIVVDMWGQQM